MTPSEHLRRKPPRLQPVRTTQLPPDRCFSIPYPPSYTTSVGKIRQESCR